MNQLMDLYKQARITTEVYPDYCKWRKIDFYMSQLEKLDKMDFTFGIITDGRQDERLNIIVDSIENENIHNYEILIVGNSTIERKNTTIIPFNENQIPMWITRKKNIITHQAKYENVVYLHDYVYLLPGWYEGWLKYGDDYKACMNVIVNADNTRYRDWCLWKNPYTDKHIIPYYIDNLSKYMYFSGAYWVAKK